MSVRQYIGARYVTKVYENSLNPASAEWESGRAYEPLTLVTYLNSSYLSKKEVPASVGDPASNPTYWVITGAYNGQITTLQNQINQINSELTSTLNKKIIVISDSYGTNLPDGVGDTFFDYMRQYSGLDSAHLRGYGYSGCGFVNNLGGGTFEEKFTLSSAAITDKDEYGTILVAAGRNDYIASEATILTAIGSFVNYCKLNYPNARVKLAFIANGDNSTAGTRDEQLTVLNAYRNAVIYDCDYIAGGEAILKNTSLMNADFIHPNDSGRQAIAKYLLQGLHNGSISVNYNVQNVVVTAASDVSWIGTSLRYSSYMSNGNITLTRGEETAGFVNFAYNTFNIPSGNNIEHLIGSVGSGFVRYPQYPIYLPNKGYAKIYEWIDSSTVSTTYIETEVNYILKPDGNVYVSFYIEQPYNVARILINGCTSFTYPAVKC